MNELEIKTERLVRMLNAENLGGVLINSQHNFAWLTGGRNNGVDASRENGVASLLVKNNGERFVLANAIEMPRMLAEEVSANDFAPIEFGWEAEKANPNLVLETARNLLDENAILTADIFYNPKYRIVENLIARCRYQLTIGEIERFRSLGKDAGAVFVDIHDKIAAGQTEREIADVVRFELGKRGINSIVTLIAADERINNFRHPIATENVWNKTLMIVVCAKRGGLIASLSRIYSVGAVSDEMRRKTDAVARIHARMMHATRPNATGKDIFEVTKRAYSEQGFSGEENKHHQGGACGYKTRDWVAHSASNESVLPEQAFAWNPSIAGTKSEETFLVTENGAETITATPNFPTIRNEIDGIEYLTPDILVL